MIEHDRSPHDVGMAVIHAIGDAGFGALSSALDGLDPGFRRLLVEGAYAGIIARPNLALKHRELVTVAVLTTMGNADSALKYHAAGMLNTGWSAEELLETVLHPLVYAGVPTTVAAVRIVSKVFSERGIRIGHEMRPAPRRAERHDPYVAWLFTRESERSGSLSAQMHDDFTKRVYGAVWSRPALSLKDRQLATLAVAIAQENQLDAVRLHLDACLRIGWTRSELTEVLIQLTGYIGWPLILPITSMALDVFERNAKEGSSHAPLADEPNEGPREGLTGGQTEGLTEGQSEGLAVSRLSVNGQFALSLPERLAQISPVVARYLEDLGLVGYVYESAEETKTRRLTDIACLACLARNADAEILSEHVKDALSSGASKREIVEAILRALPHAGVFATRHGLEIATKVFEEMAHADFPA
jgi:4-carboxymuconolactone decarboxylase